MASVLDIIDRFLRGTGEDLHQDLALEPGISFLSYGTLT